MNLSNTEEIKTAVSALKILAMLIRDEYFWYGDQWNNLNKMMCHIEEMEKPNISDNIFTNHLEQCLEVFKMIKFKPHAQNDMNESIRAYELMLNSIKLLETVSTIESKVERLNESVEVHF